MIIAIATLLLLLPFHAFAGKVPVDDSDPRFQVVQMIENNGYPCENHEITTEDGYILTYQRIPHGKNDDGSGRKPAVLVMHGIISSSVDYVKMGVDRGLSYLLADLGYDVWLGNARGTPWSSNHTTLDMVKDAEQFFDYSWHQIGYYDLPAAIDHILKVNGGDSLQYVAHSQGCTAFLVLASTRPEYNEKIKLASLMAPASFMEHQNKPVLEVVGKYVYKLQEIFSKYNVYEIFSKPISLPSSCSTPENYNLCLGLVGLIDNKDPPQLQPSDFALILSGGGPATTSLKQFYHYGQLIKNGGFRQYDYGTEKNLEIYGTETPPAYDLSKISAPVALYYGKNDGIVNYMDVETVIKNIPNLVLDYLVEDDLFSHIDFVFAEDVIKLVYVDLTKTMQMY